MDPPMADLFDFEQFRRLLFDASKTAFLLVQKLHTNESFYFFALNIAPSLGYVFPYSETEEELTFAAQDYLKLGWHPELSVAEARENLRWGTNSKRTYSECGSLFQQVNEFIEPVTGILDSFPPGPWDEFHAFFNRFIEVCIYVLKQLDSEGVFGTGEQRNTIALNIFVGDSTDEQWLEYARELNPDAVYARVVEQKRFARTLEAQLLGTPNSSLPASFDFEPDDL